MRLRLAALLAPALLLLLAGCATLPATPAAEQTYSGRFALTASLDGRSENQAGRFTLHLTGPQLTLDLATPLGTTLARVEDGPRGARLRAPGADGSLREAQGANGEALAQELLGWPLPVAGIRHWIEGRPVPGQPAQTSTEGDTQVIRQSDWTIAVQDRFAGGTPRRLQLSRAAAPALSATAGPIPAITLRLVLDEPAQ